jgi:AcrR family transcriptional regulator
MANPTSRATERRAEQRTALVAAAERRIAADGTAGLRARDLAQDIGVALGAIYNLVADMDELVLLVAGQTLGRLDDALSAAAEAAAAAQAQDRLKAVARAYLGFARAHTHACGAASSMMAPPGPRTCRPGSSSSRRACSATSLRRWINSCRAGA